MIPCDGNDTKTRLKKIEEFYDLFRWGNLLRKKETSGMKGFFAGFSGFITSIFGGAAAAEAMGFSLTPLIPVAGVASLGIGMACCAYVWWSNSQEETACLREWTERCRGLEKRFPRHIGVVDWKEEFKDRMKRVQAEYFGLVRERQAQAH